jgi:molybdopterin converting factor small subunit
MADKNDTISVSVVAFGPLKDEIASKQIIVLEKNSTIEQLINLLNIEKWLNQGLTVALNGERCELSSILENGDDLALLPPVSGG